MAENSGVTWKWTSGSAKTAARPIQDELAKRVRLAGERVRSAIVQAIGQSTREQGPSKPGEPPHADTGRLRQSIMAVPEDGGLTIGSAVRYGGFLECGTERMEPRPFIVLTLYSHWKEAEMIIGFPLRIEVHKWE